MVVMREEFYDGQERRVRAEIREIVNSDQNPEAKVDAIWGVIGIYVYEQRREALDEGYLSGSGYYDQG